ncbi:hypothetical protein [Curtobacterium sp. BRD11]|uniref:hypothetical protein n=1 Tax=Curtobacterium sp. BRD11 TaxID=2962581 RepID=UPI002882978C|nr:hypothetical protein [Curtobacterium sp. BRD11]MDT0211217.1 hypothetical protein [Curtobacterium sp. BRD11]
MDLDDTAKLLTIIAAYDNRNVQRETVVVWQQALAHLTLDVAQQAVVLHFKESLAYLLPGHVNASARRVLDDRARQQRISAPALERPAITLDRAAHEAEVAQWVQHYREHPDER